MLAGLLRPLLPAGLRRQLRFELKMLWRRGMLALRHPADPGRGLLLNLGCGGAGRSGWFNVDAFPGDGVDLACDLRRRIPLPDGCARGVFCEHFLEHLDVQTEVPLFLQECRRLLAPGGVLRIVVPDAGRYLLAYGQGDWRQLAAMRPLDEHRVDRWFGIRYRTRMELINAVFRQFGEHLFAYDAETLEATLRAAGFEQVGEKRYGQGAMADLCIDRADRAGESLYMEAVR